MKILKLNYLMMSSKKENLIKNIYKEINNDIIKKFKKILLNRWKVILILDPSKVLVIESINYEDNKNIDINIYDIDRIDWINDFLYNVLDLETNKRGTEYKVISASWDKLEWWNKLEKIWRIIFEYQIWLYNSEEEAIEDIKSILKD